MCSSRLHTLSNRVQVVCSDMLHVTCILSESMCTLHIAQRWQTPHVSSPGLPPQLQVQHPAGVHTASSAACRTRAHAVCKVLVGFRPDLNR